MGTLSEENRRILSLGLATITLMLLFSYCNTWMGIGDDRVVEEIVEAAIESQTGLDIDLTPSSIE